MLNRHLNHLIQKQRQEKKSARKNLFSKLRQSRVKLCFNIFMDIADHSPVSLDKCIFFVLHIVVLNSVYKECSILPSPIVENLFH